MAVDGGRGQLEPSSDERVVEGVLPPAVYPPALVGDDGGEPVPVAPGVAEPTPHEVEVGGEVEVEDAAVGDAQELG